MRNHQSIAISQSEIHNQQFRPKQHADFAVYKCIAGTFSRLLLIADEKTRAKCYDIGSFMLFKDMGDLGQVAHTCIPQEVRMKKIFCLTLLFLSAAILSVGIPISSSRAADGSKITIAYSGNLLGYLEPCG